MNVKFKIKGLFTKSKPDNTVTKGYRIQRCRSVRERCVNQYNEAKSGTSLPFPFPMDLLLSKAEYLKAPVLLHLTNQAAVVRKSVSGGEKHHLPWRCTCPLRPSLPLEVCQGVQTDLYHLPESFSSPPLSRRHTLITVSLMIKPEPVPLTRAEAIDQLLCIRPNVHSS